MVGGAAGSSWDRGSGGNRHGGKASGGAGQGSGGRAPPGGKWSGGHRRRATARQADSEEELIYSTWPLAKTGFPQEGPHSFRELEQKAMAAGCHVTLRDRGTENRTYRPAALVIRGLRCHAVYQTFLDAATAEGADLSKAPSCSDFV